MLHHGQIPQTISTLLELPFSGFPPLRLSGWDLRTSRATVNKTELRTTLTPSNARGRGLPSLIRQMPGALFTAIPARVEGTGNTCVRRLYEEQVRRQPSGAVVQRRGLVRSPCPPRRPDGALWRDHRGWGSHHLVFGREFALSGPARSLGRSDSWPCPILSGADGLTAGWGWA